MISIFSQHVLLKLLSFFLYNKNETAHSSKNDRIRKTRKVIAQKLWARGEITSKSSSVCRTPKCNMVDLPYLLFPCTFLSSLGCLIDLMSACRAEEQQGEEKPGYSYLFMYLFLYLFITPSACRDPSCALPFDPTVSSMTIVFFQLLIGIRQNIESIWNRSISLL